MEVKQNLCQFIAARAAVPKLGVVVIDVQNTFIQGAANPNMSKVLANTERVFALSAKNHFPLLITFERDKSGDHDIPADLKRALPPGHKEFVKTTFAATSLPAFTDAVHELGLTHVVLLGSETDVCIMQTAQGLQDMGVQVLLDRDAVFSSEPNTSPAFRCLAGSGVNLLGQTEVEIALAGTSPLPCTGSSASSVLEPFRNGGANTALVVIQLDDASIAASQDIFRKEKLERLRELLLLSEWLGIPTYVTGTSAFVLPEPLCQIVGEKAKEILGRKCWLSLRDFPANAYGQVLVAGAEAGLREALAAIGPKTQVFSLEDALLAEQSALAPSPTLPLTYKSLFYGMTKSIEPEQWPSPDWARMGVTFYPVMTSPEDLAPIRNRQ